MVEPARPPGNRRVPVPTPGTLTVPPEAMPVGPPSGTIQTPPPYVPPGQAAAPGATYPQVGTAQYDLFRINEMLQGSGYDGWQMLGATPVEVIDSKPNPLYDETKPVAVDNQPTIQTRTGTFIVNIRRGDDIKQLKINKYWGDPNNPAAVVTTDPQTGAGWGWQIQSVSDQQKADPNKVGHSNPMQIGDTLWGTNNATGVFEPVPGAPKIPRGWTSITQGKTADGDTAWFGVDPADGKPKQIDTMPVIPAAAAGFGDPHLITQPDGSQVWYGVDPVDKVPKPIPGAPPIAAGPPGPGSITQAGTVFIKKGDGTYGPAPGVPDPNPPAGTKQLILGPDGFIYQQTSRGAGQGFDPDTSFTPVPYTDAAKQARANIGAIHRAGEPGTKVINGLVYHVTYRGDSQDSYDIDTTQKATPMPGTEQTTSIATSTDQPYIVQRTGGAETPTTVRNPNYFPTDPAQRAAQLSEQANSKLAELQARVAQGGYSQDQAQADFDRWWDQNIEPAKQEIVQAQQQKQLDNQLKIAAEQRAQQEEQRAAYATAQTAGNQAAQLVNAQLPYMAGPGFGQAINQLSNAWATGKPATGIDWASALTFPLPDVQAISKQITDQALAHISPTAAQGMNAATGAGTPNYGPGLPQLAPSYDYTQGLQRNQYQVGAAGGATTTVHPDGTVQIQQGGAVTPPAVQNLVQPIAAPAVPSVAGLTYKPGWPNSDPRLTGAYDPSLYMPPS